MWGGGGEWTKCYKKIRALQKSIEMPQYFNLQFLPQKDLHTPH